MQFPPIIIITVCITWGNDPPLSSTGQVNMSCITPLGSRLISIHQYCTVVPLALTHCGLVTPFGSRDLGQHWFRQWLVAWWHQAFTWTSVDLSSLRSSDVHLRAISCEISQPSVAKISLKIILLRFYWNPPGANELIVTCIHISSMVGQDLSKWKQA